MKDVKLITSFEEACAVKGIDPASVTHPYDKIATVVEVLNGDWKPDYSNSSQWKYEPRFYWSSSSGAFVYFDFALWYTFTHVGARLVYKDLDTLLYAVDQPAIMELYNELMKP